MKDYSQVLKFLGEDMSVDTDMITEGKILNSMILTLGMLASTVNANTQKYHTPEEQAAAQAERSEYNVSHNIVKSEKKVLFSNSDGISEVFANELNTTFVSVATHAVKNKISIKDTASNDTFYKLVANNIASNSNLMKEFTSNTQTYTAFKNIDTSNKVQVNAAIIKTITPVITKKANSIASESSPTKIAILSIISAFVAYAMFASKGGSGGITNNSIVKTIPNPKRALGIK